MKTPIMYSMILSEETTRKHGRSCLFKHYYSALSGEELIETAVRKLQFHIPGSCTLFCTQPGIEFLGAVSFVRQPLHALYISHSEHFTCCPWLFMRVGSLCSCSTSTYFAHRSTGKLWIRLCCKGFKSGKGAGVISRASSTVDAIGKVYRPVE